MNERPECTVHFLVGRILHTPFCANTSNNTTHTQAHLHPSFQKRTQYQLTSTLYFHSYYFHIYTYDVYSFLSLLLVLQCIYGIHSIHIYVFDIHTYILTFYLTIPTFPSHSLTSPFSHSPLFFLKKKKKKEPISFEMSHFRPRFANLVSLLAPSSSTSTGLAYWQIYSYIPEHTQIGHLYCVRRKRRHKRLKGTTNEKEKKR